MVFTFFSLSSLVLSVPRGSEMETDHRWQRSDEPEPLPRGFPATDGLPATKIALKIGRRLVQLEFDTAHISAHHTINQVTRQGSRPGYTRKEDITIADYWAAAARDPAQETRHLLKDLQDDIDTVYPWLDTISICPPLATDQGTGKMKASEAGPRDASPELMQTRHAFYAYNNVVLLNSVIVLLESDARGAFSSWSEEAKQSAVLATSVSCVQTATAIIDWVKMQDRLSPSQIVLFRLTVGSIRRFRAAIGESADLRPPEGCQDWDDLFNYLPGAKPASSTVAKTTRQMQALKIGTGDNVGNGRRHRAFESISLSKDSRKQTEDRHSSLETQKGKKSLESKAGGMEKESGSIALLGNEDTTTDDFYALLARGELEWEKRVKSEPSKGDRKMATLRALLEDAGIKGNDPIRMD